jgi:hypothetical protein
MKKQEPTDTEKLLEKFDNQLLDLLTAELRSVKYARTQAMTMWNYNHPIAS